MNQNCLVCNANVNIATCVNINNTSVKYSNEKLVSIVVNILGAETPVDNNSSVCGRCYSLFKLYEQAQWTAKNTEREILKTYHLALNRRSDKNSNKDIILPDGDEQLLHAFEQRKNCLNIDISEDLNVIKTVTNVKVKTSNSEKYSLKNYFEDAAKHIFETSGNNSSENVEKEKQDLSNVLLTEQENEARSSNNVITDKSEYQVFNEEYKDKEEVLDNLMQSEIQIEHDEETEQSKFEFEEEETQFFIQSLHFSCPSCKREFNTKMELRNHVKSHSELKPFMCEICGHSYRHKQALQIHIGMHNGINPFQCSHCGKCFTQKGTLMRHMLIHSGETPYQCEICGKRFVHHTSYNMHILSHTREKAYKCDICNLPLLSTSHLKRHMRVHTGEKPYSCPICFKSFAQRYNLQTHKKIHDSKTRVKRRSKNTSSKNNDCT